jgi:quercetin dioxygenase-like cupin family protein
MEVNADFTRRVVVHGAEEPWVASPMAGVDRRMLDRIGGEVARATSIVRYAPGSAFSAHTHTGGEEFMVLEGVFQDEHGDFPAGSYIRNPPTTSHTPSSAEGCVIFVKLWQFDLDDRTSVKIDTNKMASVPDDERPGVAVMPLFEDGRESVRIETWAPGAEIGLDTPEGAEFLVLEGEFEESGERLRSQSWLRLPMEGRLDAKAGPRGAKVWVKTRHLRFVEPPRAA